MKNENVSSEMIEIMQELHKNVPIKCVIVDGVQRDEVIESCLFGGDQLTVARARSAKRHRQDSATSVERLDGLVPVVEDWHTKMCWFEVIHKERTNLAELDIIICTECICIGSKSISEPPCFHTREQLKYLH